MFQSILFVGGDVNAVNARELWEKLGSKQQFANWIQNRIEKYEFVDGVDFIVNKFINGENKGFHPIDYFISLDMAKELSMVENNEQGKKARRYFIECEKKVINKELPPVHNLALCTNVNEHSALYIIARNWRYFHVLRLYHLQCFILKAPNNQQINYCFLKYTPRNTPSSATLLTLSKSSVNALKRL